MEAVGVQRLGRRQWAALALALLPLVLYAWTGRHRLNDLRLYAQMVHALLAGGVPNVDFRFEYPPYALLWFLPAGLLSAASGDADAPRFALAFMLQLLLLDAAVKWALLREGGARRWLPLVLYGAAAWVEGIHYLKRFDLIPAALCVAALLLLARGRAGWAGAALSVGVMTKLYPVVLLPAALAWALRQGQARRLLLGLAAGLLPLLPLSLLWPWWRFADFHVGRGLQVESLWASVLWGLHRLGWVRDVAWAQAVAAYELHGAAAEAVRGVSRWVWVGGSLAAAGVSMRAAGRLARGDVAGLARVMLLPLLAFVALNPVLSPQYLVWLMGPAALALLRGRVGVPVAVFVAVLLTRLVYTTDTYKVGYAPVHLLLLNARNFLLLWATLALMWELGSPRPPPEQAGAEH